MKLLTAIYKSFIVYFIGLSFLNITVTAQNYTVKIKGEILDSNNVGITDCYVKVIGIKSRIVYNYNNTGHKNTFTLDANPINTDSLTIIVSCVGYTDAVMYCPPNTKYIFLNVLLQVKYHTLNGIVIKSPPVWQRGDTTFYNVNSFAEGNEKKLRDILEKIPGFEITSDGQLRYKRKIINKIMIDGEEIFADKISLLLNNFPAHVLKNIQAIENQSTNKLLKGLTGDGNLVLNLGLNKDKQKAIFGDGEVGIGTAEKYTISPVLFSLLGKLKAGFIGNYNNIGNGIDWRQLYELKNEPERLAENWLKNNISAQIIPGFENRWYINNAQSDNRLQVNTTISKRLKNKIEINYFKDRQYQNSYAASSFYNGNNFYSRNDSNETSYKPSLFKIKETLIWPVDSIREFKFISEYFTDNTKSYQNTAYDQNGINSYLSNSIANHCFSITSRIEYTHRKSVSKANQIFFEFNHQNQFQTTAGLSSNWAAIYSLTNNQYNVLYQIAKNKINIFKTGIVHFKSLKKSNIETGINYTQLTTILQDSVFVNNTKKTLPDVVPSELNNYGNYAINKISGFIKRKYTFHNKNALSLNLTSGFSHALAKEIKFTTPIITPELDLQINYSIHYRKIQPFLIFTISQSQAAPYELSTYLKPLSNTIYSRHKNIQQPLIVAKLDYFQSWYWVTNIYSSLQLSFYKTFSSFATINNINNFVNFETDSIVTVPTYNLNISTSQQIPSLFLKALIRITTGFTQSTILLANNSKIIFGQNRNSFFNLSVRKNWHRKYYIDLRSEVNFNNFKLPENVSGRISPKVLNLKNALVQRIVLNKKMYLSASASVFSNNLFTNNKTTFHFFDAEYNIKLPKSPITLILRGENLTNTKKFYNSFTNPFSQSFFNVPLIKRRIFISCKYNL